MLAYHNEPKLKVKTVAAMKADIKAERVIKGSYWDAKKNNGCFVGCVIRGSAHVKFETVLGIPQILARLGDRLFEGLPYEDAKKFTVDFLASIRVGADLSSVWPKFAHFMLVDPEYGVIKFAKTERTKKSIQYIGDLYQRKINGEDIDVNVWLEARRNADAAAAADADADAADAAYAAADAAAAADADADAADAAYAAADAYAAYAYAYADAAAAAAYAYADDADADADAARSRHYVALAARLIQFLKEAK